MSVDLENRRQVSKNWNLGETGLQEGEESLLITWFHKTKNLFAAGKEKLTASRQVTF